MKLSAMLQDHLDPNIRETLVKELDSLSTEELRRLADEIRSILADRAGEMVEVEFYFSTDNPLRSSEKLVQVVKLVRNYFPSFCLKDAIDATKAGRLLAPKEKAEDLVSALLSIGVTAYIQKD